MVFSMELTHHEIAEKFDTKYIATSSTGYILPPSIYKISDITLMLKSLLPDDVKVKNTIDDITLKSNLSTEKQNFTKKSFLYTMLGFNYSPSGMLGEIKGFFQKIPGTYKSEKPLNITGIGEMHLKSNVIDGSFEDGCREPNFLGLLLINHRVIKYTNNQELNFSKI